MSVATKPKRRPLGWIILISLVAGVALGLLVTSLLSHPAPSRIFYASRPAGTMLVAHMGGDNLYPGDTGYAYEQAKLLGADVFDGDAHITKDGVIILMHDEAVDRTTNGHGQVEDLTLAELKALDAGYGWSPDGKSYPFRGKGITVPTLEELFQQYPDQKFLIEIKLSKLPIAVPMAKLIRKYNMQDKIVIASFLDTLMQEFRRAAPEVATSASKTEVVVFVLLQKVGLSGLVSPEYQSLQVPFETSESMGIPIMTSKFVQAAHAKGVAVEVWTLNEPNLMKTYIDWGIDGIDSDRPDVLKKALGR